MPNQLKFKSNPGRPKLGNAGKSAKAYKDSLSSWRRLAASTTTATSEALGSINRRILLRRILLRRMLLRRILLRRILLRRILLRRILLRRILLRRILLRRILLRRILLLIDPSASEVAVVVLAASLLHELSESL